MEFQEQPFGQYYCQIAVILRLPGASRTQKDTTAAVSRHGHSLIQPLRYAKNKDRSNHDCKGLLVALTMQKQYSTGMVRSSFSNTEAMNIESNRQPREPNTA